MKGKHLRQRVEATITLSILSNCTRRQFGCLILDPESNMIVAEGYNGALRGGGHLCSGNSCKRETEAIESGTQLDIGCVHAEQNAIYNAARRGICIVDSWVFVNGEPCPLCAKALVQVGVERVFCVSKGYSTTEGVEMLRDHGVAVHAVNIDTNFDDLLDSIYAKKQAKQQQRGFNSPPAASPFSSH